MTYRLRFTRKAHKQFAALDKYVQRKIQEYLNKYVHDNENPYAVGKRLAENLQGYWRYRIGDYRIICEIKDDIFEVIAVKVGHRSKIYN